MRNLLQSNEFRENRNARFPRPASPRLGLTGRLPSCTRRWAGKGGGALLGEGRWQWRQLFLHRRETPAAWQTWLPGGQGDEEQKGSESPSA